MNWLDKYKPNCLTDLKTNHIEIQKAIKWVENYKKDCKNSKKVLFILGNTGTGKTVLSELILKDYNYQKIELNSTDIRSQKKIGEFLKKSLTYKNIIDMFHNEKLPIGILIDEIDTICKLSDKGGFTEFLNILKQNDKFETLKKNILEKKKIKKTKILVDDYIKLYNPIICTSNDINDKKINELKKYSEVIILNKPSNEEIFLIIDDLYNINNQKIENDARIAIANYSQGDIRRLIILLEDLHYFSKGDIITIDLINTFKKTYREKEEDIQLINSTRDLLSKKMDIKSTQLYFDIDCLLTPLMIYHNSINYIKNTDDTSIKKLGVYKNILNSLCIHDTIQTNIFEAQDWDELYDIASIYGATIPNHYFNQLKTKKDNKEIIEIQFTSLLNKISQMYVNKKLLNSAQFSIGKINYDTDEIIYLTEIISNYFNDYKETQNDKSDNTDDTEDSKENEENEEEFKNTYKKPLSNNSKLITFMNNYNMNIDCLENILKIEKLNQTNEKKKKKFTLKIKKDISKFLITKD
jgi:chromosomal replication initiation ATPase DnaA